MPNNGTGPSGTPLTNFWNTAGGWLRDATYTKNSPVHRGSSKPAKSGTTSKDGGTRYSTLPDGRQIYRSGGISYDRKSGQQVFFDVDTDKPYTHDEGFSLTKKKGGKYDGQDWAVPHSEQNLDTSNLNGNSGGRNDTRTNAAGVVQSGTNMGPRIATLEELSGFAGAGIANFAGPSFPDQPAGNKISAAYPNTTGQVDLGGGNMYNVQDNGRIIGQSDAQEPGAFQGTQLPTTGTNPFEGDPAKTPAFNAQAPGITGANYDNYGADGGVAAASDTDSGKGPSFSGKEKSIEGGSTRSGQSLNDALGDKAGMVEYARGLRDKDGLSASDGASSTEEMRRRAAFFSEGGSLEGMKRVKAGMGMVTAGAKNYANVNGEMQEMSSADMRSILQAAPGQAQALKDKWVSALTSESTKPEAPASAQDPYVANDQAAQTIKKQRKNEEAHVTNARKDGFDVTDGIYG